MASAALPMGLMDRLGLRNLSGGNARDLGLGLGVIGIITVMIIPLPAILLDLGLALSIGFAVMILMSALVIEKPLQLSSFPTILLIVTMLRLALNIASTRRILGHGHEGTDAAGSVIQAFGTFLMGGNVIMGLTLFAILLIINFVVITKGAGRIAEVAARFSLDAMPGKQMAIDADLSAGLIDEKTAKARRAELEGESAFFGAMDGASKFVRGDAIAGLMITFLNIVVGLIIGIVVHGVKIGDAFHTYTILTVGDGLITQIPALIVSIAAGLLVTKSGVSGRTEAALVEQLARFPKAMGMAAFAMIGLAVMPGLPFVPFALLGAAFGVGAYKLSKRAEAKRIADAQAAALEAVVAPEDEPIAATLLIDPVRIELGFALLGLINNTAGDHRLEDQVRALRKQMAIDYGFVLPSVRLLDNLGLQANEYVLYVKETEVGRGELRADKLMVIHNGDDLSELGGEQTNEPAFGLPALWIDRSSREHANFRGLTVVDASTVITTHLTEVLKDNIADLFSYSETQKLLKDLPEEAQKLVGDLVPSKVSVSSIQRVLQNLLSEGVSIRDLATILEGIAEAVGYTQNIMMITEHVRARLARQISSVNSRDGVLPVVMLSPEWEQNFGESLIGNGEDRQLAMAPSQLQGFIADVKEVFDRLAKQGELPCLLTSPIARPYVRSVIERVRPATVVLSQNEIHPRAKIRAFGSV